MDTFFTRVLDTSDFTPRWECGNWTDFHGWLHIGADIATALAYMAIPVVLAVLVMRRSDRSFSGIFWLFSAFIFACGMVHLVEASIFWWPVYRLSALVKVATAVVSIFTAIKLISLAPKLLQMRSPEELQRIVEQQTRTIEEQRHLLERLIHCMDDGVIAVNAKGEFILTNPGAERIIRKPITGVTPEEWSRHYGIYKSDRDELVPPEQLPLAQAIRGESVRNMEMRVMHEDTPTTVWVEATANPIVNEQGQPQGGVVVFRDITKSKADAEALQRQAEELRQANQDLDDFIHVASHDLKQPVRHLMTLSTWLREDLGEAIGEEASSDLERIQTTALRMQQLIQDLLELSRAGRSEMKWSLVDLNELLDEVLQALEVEVKEAGAVIERPRLPVVEGEARLLTQVYLNLIGNALKYRGGKPAQIELTVEEKKDHWVLGARDSGIGIKSEYCEKIFEPFFRLHNQEKYSGSGVGLAIVRKCAERLGGKIEVTSSPGHGAHFFLTLPKRSSERGKVKNG